MKKRFTALLTAIATVSMCIPSFSVFGESADLPELKLAPASEIYKDYLANPLFYNTEPSVIDVSENADIEINSNLPEKFDLRSEGLVSPVRNQGAYGTCWAHAAIASMETSMIKRNQFIDIAEWQLAYFATVPNNEPKTECPDYLKLFEPGGSQSQVIDSVVTWQGISDENDYPYDNADYVYNENNRYDTDYHISDINMAFYQLYQNDKVNAAVKDCIYNGNAVTLSFLSYDGFLNEETSSYYGSTDVQNESMYESSHEVAVIGWDDNYSKENFRDDIRPQNNGAWLIKNSWGANSGNNGYYWISYEDEFVCFDPVYTIEYAEKYDNIYNCTGTNSTWSYSYSYGSGNVTYMSNIYTAERDEFISGAGFFTTDNGTEYEICIYTDITDENNPVSGEMNLPESGVEKYAGYHTVDFDTAVYVEKGQKYSVVLKVTNPENHYTIATTNRFNENVVENCSSFLSVNGKEWENTQNCVDDWGNQGIGYICCDVFTNNTGKIVFSDYSPFVKKNSEIALYNDEAEPIYYSLDNSIWNLYTEPVTITGPTSIYASLSETGENAFVRKYDVKRAVLSNITYDDNMYNGDIKIINDNQPITDITETIPADIEEFCIYPAVYGNAEININGETVNSGAAYTINLKDKEKDTLEIVVSAENEITTEYTVNFTRGFYDYFSECLIIDENTMKAYSPDGKILEKYDDISDYIGQTITVEYNDSSAKYNVAIPERPVLPDDLEYSLDYSGEEITFNYNVQLCCAENSDYVFYTYENKVHVPFSYLSGNKIRVYLQADNTHFRSGNYIEFEMPSLSQAPDEVKIKDIQEHSITLEAEDGMEYAVMKVEEYDGVPVVDPKLLEFEWSKSVEFDNLLSGTKYYVAVRYSATDENPFSQMNYKTVETKGNKQLAVLDYENEMISLINEQAIIQDSEGNVLNYNEEYDYYMYELSVSEYIGSTLTITSANDETQKYEMAIPERPVFKGEYSIDNSQMLVNVTTIDNTPVQYQFNYNIQWENLWLNDEGTGSIMYPDMLDEENDMYLLLRNPATENSFASRTESILISKRQPIDNLFIEIKDSTSTSLTISEIENAEYAVMPASFGGDIMYCDSNVFTGLEPNEYYSVFVRLKATDEYSASYSVSATVQMPANDSDSIKIFSSYGDVNGDGMTTSYDALEVLNHVTGVKYLAPEIWGYGNCDLSADIEASDALLILQLVVGIIDTLPLDNGDAKG